MENWIDCSWINSIQFDLVSSNCNIFGSNQQMNCLISSSIGWISLFGQIFKILQNTYMLFRTGPKIYPLKVRGRKTKFWIKALNNDKF